MDPQQGSFCPVLLRRIEQDWVWYRSKGKLYSWIKAWRDTSLCSRDHTPSPPLISPRASSQDAGLQGGGRFWPSFTCMLLTVSPPSCIAVSSAASARGLLSLNLSAAFSYEELWSEVKCARPPAHHPYACDTTLSTEKEKKMLDFTFYPGSIFISQEL